MAKSEEKFNVKQVITEEIIKSLEEAGGVWHKDWRSMGVPMNADSNKPYRGINFLILSLTGMAKGYKSNKWITYKNMQKQGGELLPTGLLDENEKEVKQKTTMITFYSPLTVKDKASGLDKSIPMLK